MRKLPFLLVFIVSALANVQLHAQELNAKVNVNYAKLENTKTDIFPKLQTTIEEFLNNHKWTEITFRENEKIQCTFNLTINEYNVNENTFKCTLLMSSNRPVFNSNYNTVCYSVNDKEFVFRFTEFDQLEYQENQIDNNLVALLAYYAYMIIGMDLDSMTPKGGTACFHTAENIVSAGQNLEFPGWKAFSDNGNRFGLLNDYLDGSMEPLRDFQYIYHRKGLDKMAENPDTARAVITEGLDLLLQAYKAKNMNKIAQLFTEYKRPELVNIYSGKGTTEEKNKAYDVLFTIDASQNQEWEKIKK